MQTRSLFGAILLASQLTGCAAYTGASLALWATTERSATDWLATGITGADCRTQHLVQNKYVCEQPVVYNQSGID